MASPEKQLFVVGKLYLTTCTMYNYIILLSIMFNKMLNLLKNTLYLAILTQYKPIDWSEGELVNTSCVEDWPSRAIMINPHLNFINKVVGENNYCRVAAKHA